MKQTEMNRIMQEKITGKAIPGTVEKTAQKTALKTHPETAMETKHPASMIPKKTAIQTDTDPA